MVRSRLFRLMVIILWGTTACAVSTPTNSPDAPTISEPTTLPPQPVAPTFTASPGETPEPVDTGWIAWSPGVEWRRLWADTGAGRERLHLVRLDPSQVAMRVLYEPQHPRRISEWAATLSSALVVVNAGYFTPQMQATGLIISDGVPSGYSYDSFAGMLAVSADGRTTLRWLQTRPYRPGEGLVQAVQSFPVLVKPGGVMGFAPDADEGQRARRTVVAQDTSGRILLIVSPAPLFSLHELAVWLTESDLGIDIALNLDGGTSTGLWLQGHDDNIDSFVPLPAVIIFARQAK